MALSGLGGDELFGGYRNTFVQSPQVYRGLAALQALPGGAALARTALRLLPGRQRWARTANALARRVLDGVPGGFVGHRTTCGARLLASGRALGKA